MKKTKLDPDVLFDELQDSPFFRKNGARPPARQGSRPEEAEQPSQDTAIAPSLAPSHHDTNEPLVQPEMVETIRQAVREVGRLAGNYRFTQTEKKALNEIRYTYSQSGIATSDNQIARIGLNFLLEDYRQNGRNSVLAQVLKKLNQ
jgi:hypothetical protein